MEFTLDEAIKARQALRDALKAGPESFSLPAFVGMLSDEIEQLRAAGQDDRQIAMMISGVTGKDLSAQQIADHYALPDARRR